MGLPHTREVWWKFWLARLLGRWGLSIDCVTGPNVVIREGYLWRDRIYIVKYHILKTPE